MRIIETLSRFLTPLRNRDRKAAETLCRTRIIYSDPEYTKIQRSRPFAYPSRKTEIIIKAVSHNLDCSARSVLALLLLAPLSTQAAYRNLFKIEGEDLLSSIYITYATLNDMLTDTNRTGFQEPNGGGASRNLVGSESEILSNPDPAPVPEPASLFFFSLALVALGSSIAAASRRPRHVSLLTPSIVRSV